MDRLTGRPILAPKEPTIWKACGPRRQPYVMMSVLDNQFLLKNPRLVLFSTTYPSTPRFSIWTNYGSRIWVLLSGGLAGSVHDRIVQLTFKIFNCSRSRSSKCNIESTWTQQRLSWHFVAGAEIRRPASATDSLIGRHDACLGKECDRLRWTSLLRSTSQHLGGM